MSADSISNLFEAVTILCFGISWPISIRKSYLSRTAKGKSLLFEVFLLIGYAFGIARKIIQLAIWDKPASPDFLFFLSGVFYVVNFIAIVIDMSLYVRNSRLDRERAERGEE